MFMQRVVVLLLCSSLKTKSETRYQQQADSQVAGSSFGAGAGSGNAVACHRAEVLRDRMPPYMIDSG